MRASTGLVVVVTALGAGYVSARFQNLSAARAQSDYEASVAPPSARHRPAAESLPVIEEEGGEMPLRDAMAMPRAPAALAPARAVPPRSPMAAGPAASGDPKISADSMKALLTQPMTYITQKTWLGKPAGFQKFISDPKRVKRYIDNPIVKSVIDSPAMTRVFVSNSMLVSAFLASPAMRDPAAMKALASSPLLRELAQHKGVQAALADPAIMQKLLMTNPQAAQLLLR